MSNDKRLGNIGSEGKGNSSSSIGCCCWLQALTDFFIGLGFIAQFNAIRWRRRYLYYEHDLWDVAEFIMNRIWGA